MKYSDSTSRTFESEMFDLYLLGDTETLVKKSVDSDFRVRDFQVFVPYLI